MRSAATRALTRGIGGPAAQQPPGSPGIQVLQYDPPRRFAAGARVGNIIYLAGEEGRVLSMQHIKARGSGSGIELEITSFTVWSFDEDGLVTRVEIYLPHEEARARAVLVVAVVAGAQQEGALQGVDRAVHRPHTRERSVILAPAVAGAAV